MTVAHVLLVLTAITAQQQHELCVGRVSSVSWWAARVNSEKENSPLLCPDAAHRAGADVVVVSLSVKAEIKKKGGGNVGYDMMFSRMANSTFPPLFRILPLLLSTGPAGLPLSTYRSRGFSAWETYPLWACSGYSWPHR